MFKQYIKSKIFNLQNYFNIRIYSNIKKHKIVELIKLLKVKNHGYKLLRYGDNHDGGYLIPEIKNIKFCYTVGVGNTIKFEKDLGKKVKFFLADRSVKKPNLNNSKFIKKFVGTYNDKDMINVNDWIKDSENTPCILKIDAEGSEYEILHAINNFYLKKIKILILEFHNLHLISNKYFYSYVFNCLKKIDKYFVVSHLHPNNNFPLINFYNLKIPRDLEVTFLNRKYIKYSKKTQLPHLLDQPAIKNKKNIILPNYYF